MPENTENKLELKRQLGLFDSIMMMVGIVIGSGIFLTTGIMAETLPSSGLIILAWIFGGVLTLTGALTYAELGASMPEAGGQYVYLRTAYGPLYGFLFGWMLFLIAMGGSIATLGVAFSEYLSTHFPVLSTSNFVFTADLSFISNGMVYRLSTGQLAAVAVIIALSAFNYYGVIFGKLIQNIVTLIKIGTLLIFISFGLLITHSVSSSEVFTSPDLPLSVWITGFGIALIGINWAFDGWNNINYAAGEIKNPKKNLPYSLIWGTLLITLLYVLTNIVYFKALSVPDMSGVVTVAEKSALNLFGGKAAGLLTAGVLISVFGALNGSIFVGPRVYYAMARDGLFFKKAENVHPKYKTPGTAIWLQAIWAVLLTVSGTFEQLFTFVMFATIAYWIAGTASVFTIRKKYPDMNRPYKTWGYPYTPIIFIVFASGILINTLIERPVESLIGIGLTLIGIPVFHYWNSKNTQRQKHG